jgi:hypothetical protein
MATRKSLAQDLQMHIQSDTATFRATDKHAEIKPATGNAIEYSYDDPAYEENLKDGFYKHNFRLRGK